MTCTWKDCGKEATTPQISKDGSQWANLCDEHEKIVSEGYASLNPKLILKNWVLAHGGAKKMAELSMGR